MKFFKAMMGRDNSDKIDLFDVIEYNNSLWVVPEWLNRESLDCTMPARMIRIENHHFKIMSDTNDGFEMLITYPIPTSLLDGSETRAEGEEFETIKKPDIKIPLEFNVH